MQARADLLRQRIATYRRRLAENPDIDQVRLYLEMIVADQRELDRLEILLKQGESKD